MKRVIIELEVHRIYPDMCKLENIHEVVRYKDENTLNKSIENHIKNLNNSPVYMYEFVKILKDDINSCDRFALFGLNEV